MKAIYKLHFDCGRQGCVEGLFVAHKKMVDQLIETGVEIYFGEILGKHSEICGPLEPHDVTLVSERADDVETVERLELEVGPNPVKIAQERLRELGQ